MRDEVVFTLDFSALDPGATTALDSERVDGEPFGKAPVGKTDRHRVLFDERAHVEVAFFRFFEGGEAWRVEFLQEVGAVFSDDVPNQDVVGQDGFVVVDLAQQFGVVRDQFFNLQPHQLDQTQGADRFGLQTREGQAGGFAAGLQQVGGDDVLVAVPGGDGKVSRHQPCDGVFPGAARADDANDFVDVAHGQNQTLQAVGLALGFFEQVFGASSNHHAAVVDPTFDHRLQSQGARTPSVQGNLNDRESRLQWGVLVQLAFHHMWIRAAFEVHHDTGAVLLPGEVLDVSNFFDASRFGRIHHLLDQVVLHHLVRDLVDHQDGVALGIFLVGDLAADLDSTSTTGVGLGNAAPTNHRASGGEVGSGDGLQQIAGGDVRGVQHLHDGPKHFTGVVRGQRAAHAHRNAGGAVDQQVGESSGEDGWFVSGLVVVGFEINRVELEVRHHLDRGLGHAGFGVSHGRRRIAVNGTEVPLLVDEHGPHLPILTHVDQRGIDHRLAVGVVVAGGVTGDLGAFSVLGSGAKFEVMHGHQDASLGRLEAISNVGQSPVGDGAHGIEQIALVELAFDLNINNTTAGIGGVCGV